MYYYGDRSCNCHPSEDIGIKYFSSSTLKLFINDQKENPQDYKYKVIKIFKTCREDAKQLEVDLHKRFDVKKHPKFINKANQTSSGFSVSGCKIIKNINGCKNPNFGNKWSDEQKLNLRETKKANPYTHTPERIEKIKSSSSGCNNSMAKKWILTSPEGIRYEANGNLNNLCKKLNLAYTSIIGVYRGSYKVTSRSKYSKWKLEEISD